MILGRLETALARSSQLRRRAEALAPPWGLTRARARLGGARAQRKFTVRARGGVELTARAGKGVGIYCARGEGEFTIGITGARSQELALASALPCPEKNRKKSRILGPRSRYQKYSQIRPPLSRPPQSGKNLQVNTLCNRPLSSLTLTTKLKSMMRHKSQTLTTSFRQSLLCDTASRAEG